MLKEALQKKNSMWRDNVATLNYHLPSKVGTKIEGTFFVF